MGNDELFGKLCSYDNLELAFKRARKGKTLKHYVIEFENNLKQNLLDLRIELLFHAYRPKPLKTFIVRDPKTRKISKSEFRDRIVHHAICNILEPIFERYFIADSYANRKGKGTLAAVKRFDEFKRKISKNNTQNVFVLKADIKHYFEEVDREILIRMIKKRISDKRVISLIQIILDNFNGQIWGGGRCDLKGSAEQSSAGLSLQVRKGMPLGNLTSQFFANVYLNELDQFVKHKLKVKYYIRYVDDFVVLHTDRQMLEFYKEQINDFLEKDLNIVLHPTKSKIIPLERGINFLGFRIFHHHKLLRKSNMRKFRKKLDSMKEGFDKGTIDYDKAYDSLLGWKAYAEQADTYKLRKKVMGDVERMFPNKISSVEIDQLLKQNRCG